MKDTQSKNINAAAVLWFEHHIDSFTTSFKRNLASPLSFFFTISLIAIALSIPISTHIIFDSTQQLTKQWDNDKQITLFLKQHITLTEANKLAEELSSRELVLATKVIDKQQALNEFKKQTGLDAIAEDLTKNPLPHIITIEPETANTSSDKLIDLHTNLSGIKQVEQVQFDLLWFQRLQGILDVIQRIQWLIVCILLFAIALVIANVIRWEVTARHAEIEIIKLVGASDAYVRRPFLYSGFWLAFTGTLLAIIIVALCTWLVETSTTQLASLFSSDFKITTLSFDAACMIIAVMSLLGVFASWLAVTQQLKRYS